MYLEGKSFEEINAETGYAESTIKIFLRGLIDNRKYANQYSEEIKAMYNQGCKTKDIAEKIGMSYAAVNHFLLENGYKKCKPRVWSEEKQNFSDLTFAVPKKASGEKIKAGNKIYTDVTLQFAGQ